MSEQTGQTTNDNDKTTRLQRKIALIFFILGVLLSTIALWAELLGLEFTPGFGMVQMLQLLLGITCLTVAMFLYLRTLHAADAPRSLQADIGVRLAATGLVFIYVAGFADLIGIGTHVDPEFARPFVGPLQLGGIFLGTVSILVGMYFYHTSRRLRDASSMEFLMNGKSEKKDSTAV
jgi:heme/copper-type cytochrome/quinol oxidase subunit 4